MPGGGQSVSKTVRKNYLWKEQRYGGFLSVCFVIVGFLRHLLLFENKRKVNYGL